MLVHTLFLSWLSVLALVSTAARIPPRQTEADTQTQSTNVLDDFIDRLRSLIPDSLRLLTPVHGISKEYEYVVVGAGTAGTALAVRLAQNGTKVALVEAGGYYDFTNPLVSAIPGLDVLLVGSDVTNVNPLVDWSFVARNQPGANNRPIHFARGKCVGGSSALNFMIYQRPTIQSMQQWADTVDDPSYTFSNVLPYFQKSAELTGPNMDKRFSNSTPKYNPNAFPATSDNPLQVSFANYAQSFSTWLKRGFASIGIGEAQDFNSGSLMGAQYCTSTIRPSDQTRSSSATTFLKAALLAGLSNLKVYTTTRADKILFDANKKATGVSVTTGLVSYTLSATKEVIISAGAFQSPQLLMVSGIGPQDQLSAQNIPIIHESPGVGQNMWDHPTFGPSYPVHLITLTKEARDPIYLADQVLQYFTNQSGTLTNPVADYLAWEKIPQPLRSQLFSPSTQAKLASQFPPDWPEVEYISGNGFVGDFSNFLLVQPTDGRNYATILNVLIAPLSRGNVTITSPSTAQLPTINPAWLTDPADQELAIAAYKRSRQLFASAGLAPIVAGPEAYPGVEVQTDAEILDAIRNSLMTLWHPACTCKMGRASDRMAVLDSRARVRGVSGLRVVDASAFPFLPPGHPQSSVYMLAEKIADSIIQGSD